MIFNIRFYLILVSILIVFGCKISGTITDNGEGLSGVNVALNDVNHRSVTTDANGNYTFNFLWPSDYIVTPSLDGYMFNPERQIVSKKSLFKNVSDINFEASGPIPICVEDSDCEPDQQCEDGFCTDEPQCLTDENCQPDQQCLDSICVEGPECVTDSDCEPGQQCIDEACILPCVTDTDCPDGQKCEEGQCIQDIPTTTIHIELTWYTPGDPDQTDTGPGAGTDLDLHLLHANATGCDVNGDDIVDGYFDPFYDTFTNNPNPNWGIPDPMINDNPLLLRDDSDGIGPEIITLDMPEAGFTYKVGVYYFSDQGYGSSFATIRIYINGNKVLEAENDGGGLVQGDLWEVCEISWPSGDVSLIEDNGSMFIFNDVDDSCF